MLYSLSDCSGCDHRFEHPERGFLYVLDPVMIATVAPLCSEHRRLQELDSKPLMPLARLITPNLPEAACLLGHPITSQEEARDAVKALADRFQNRLPAQRRSSSQGRKRSPTIWKMGRISWSWRHPTSASVRHTGTGCTFASCHHSLLSSLLRLRSAVQEAKAFISQAIAQSVLHRIPSGLEPQTLSDGSSYFTWIQRDNPSGFRGVAGHVAPSSRAFW